MACPAAAEAADDGRRDSTQTDLSLFARVRKHSVKAGRDSEARQRLHGGIASTVAAMRVAAPAASAAAAEAAQADLDGISLAVGPSDAPPADGAPAEEAEAVEEAAAGAEQSMDARLKAAVLVDGAPAVIGAKQRLQGGIGAAVAALRVAGRRRWVRRAPRCCRSCRRRDGCATSTKVAAAASTAATMTPTAEDRPTAEAPHTAVDPRTEAAARARRRRRRQRLRRRWQ